MAGAGVSRPRRRTGQLTGMPDWLAVYRPDLWTSDLEDLLEVYYFGRFRWREACQEWAQGRRPVKLH